MVYGQIASTIVKQLVKYGSRYYRLEGQAFSKLYRGFPQSKVIGRGVRHGLTAGSVVGSLISGDDNNLNNGVSSPVKPRSKYQPYKTRGRFPARSRTKRNRFCYPSPKYRYSNSRSNR